MMMIIKDRRFGTQKRIYTGLRIHYSIRVQAYIYDCTVSFSTITSRDVIVRVIVHSAPIFSERELIICGTSACRLSVTLVHSTQPVEIFGNVSTPFGTVAIRGHPRKILRRSSQGNPSVGGLNFKRNRGSKNTAILDLSIGYISETVQDRR